VTCVALFHPVYGRRPAVLAAGLLDERPGAAGLLLLHNTGGGDGAAVRTACRFSCRSLSRTSTSRRPRSPNGNKQ
jgi:hypothetical protein